LDIASLILFTSAKVRIFAILITDFMCHVPLL
jgi:hypothetical protein